MAAMRTPLSELRLVVLLLAFPILPAGVSAWIHSGDKSPSALREEAIPLAGEVIFLDARSEEARRQNPLAWAKRLTEETWEQDLPGVLNEWTPEVHFLVFCDGGQCNRSEQVAARLRRETGIERITVIEGGERAAIRLHAQSDKNAAR